MTRFALIVAAAVALLLPEQAGAQFRDLEPEARFTVTPLIGYRLPYNAAGELTLYTFDDIYLFEYREKRGGGLIFGGEAEARLIGRLSAVASLSYAEPVTNTVTARDLIEGTEETEPFVGPTVWLARAGFSLRMPEPEAQRFRIVTYLTVAPALVREVPADNPLPSEHPLHGLFVTPWDQPINNFALNVGLKSSVHLGTPHVALHVGFDDFITFWNTTAWERQLSKIAPNEIFDYDYGRSHLLTVNAGISIRF